jgi:hypothetical protein
MVMININQHDIYWFVMAIAKKLGVWGLLGLIIAVSSSVFYITSMPALKHNIAVIKAEGVTNNSAKQFEQATTAPQTTEQEIVDFYEQFPAVDGLPEALAQLSRMATEQDLALNSGDYKLKQIKQSKEALAPRALDRYEFVLPIQGNYIQIRKFLSAVLDALPALALTDLQMVREDTLSPSVEAQLTFVLYAKGEAWNK